MDVGRGSAHFTRTNLPVAPSGRMEVKKSQENHAETSQRSIAWSASITKLLDIPVDSSRDCTSSSVLDSSSEDGSSSSDDSLDDTHTEFTIGKEGGLSGYRLVGVKMLDKLLTTAALCEH